VVKGFEIGADAVLVSGCHPGDCHYTAGNYHARRRWMLFRNLLETVGFDMRRIHFTWISAAEGRKFQQVVTEITEQTRALGPYRPYEAEPRVEPLAAVAAPTGEFPEAAAQAMREKAAQLLSEGTVKVVIGFGARGPVFVTRAEDVNRLVWDAGCKANLAGYLKRPEVRKLGRAAVVVKKCDERALVMLATESQIARDQMETIAMECNGMGEAKCAVCVDEGARYAGVDALMRLTAEQRLSHWTAEFDRCLKCYACRQVCPMCYCERCLADKNRPQAIETSAHREGNFAWHISRAMHLAGRCVGCDECARACPVGIDLRTLNLALARAAEEQFSYRAGADPAAEPLIGAFALTDKEEFIR
jgi:formate dehydrogenase (coenzyme F420) beta subunit